MNFQLLTGKSLRWVFDHLKMKSDLSDRFVLTSEVLLFWILWVPDTEFKTFSLNLFVDQSHCCFPRAQRKILIGHFLIHTNIWDHYKNAFQATRVSEGNFYREFIKNALQRQKWRFVCPNLDRCWIPEAKIFSINKYRNQKIRHALVESYNNNLIFYWQNLMKGKICRYKNIKILFKKFAWNFEAEWNLISKREYLCLKIYKEFLKLKFELKLKIMTNNII